MILSIVNEAILPVWLLWVLGGSIGSILVGLFCGLLSSPDDNTKRIVVLGSKASGKTTLWNQLMDKKVVTEYRTTDQEKIESFNVFANNRYVKVLATQGRRIKLNFPSTAYLSSPHSIPLSVVLG